MSSPTRRASVAIGRPTAFGVRSRGPDEPPLDESPEDESPLIDAMARLHADDDGQALELAEGTRFLGSFRASGLVVPVWDLAGGTEADEIEDAAASFRQRLDQALGDTAPLSGAQRRAREALRARQLTVH